VYSYLALMLGTGSSGASGLVRYVDFACLAAIEHALTLLNAATEANGRALQLDSLTVSKPVLKAPMVSALETKII
jgi:hypothetical protein